MYGPLEPGWYDIQAWSWRGPDKRTRSVLVEGDDDVTVELTF